MYIVSHLVYSVHFTLHCVAVTIGGSGQLSVSALVAGAQDHDQVQDHPIIYFPAQHDEESHHEYHVFPGNEEEINSQSLEDTQVGYTSHQTATTQCTLFSCIHQLRFFVCHNVCHLVGHLVHLHVGHHVHRHVGHHGGHRNVVSTLYEVSETLTEWKSESVTFHTY